MLVFDFSVTEVKKAAKTKENLPTLPHQLIPYDSSADPPQKLLRNDNLMKNKLTGLLTLSPLKLTSMKFILKILALNQTLV